MSVSNSYNIVPEKWPKLVINFVKAINSTQHIMKWVASFKLSLLLKNYLQRTQTLQLN